MSGGPSVWWPIDVPASRWFSEEERVASRSYHEPIQRVAVLRNAAQLAALVSLWVWLRRSNDVDLWIGVVLAVSALSIPRIMADGWHEFVHEPRFGGTPVRLAAFGVTALGRLTLEGMLLGLVALALRTVDADAALRAAGLAAALAAVIPAVSAWLGPRVVLALHRAADVDPSDPGHRVVAEAAGRLGLATPRLVVLDVEVFEGANAYVAGRRPTPVVAVSRQLLEGPADLLAHVVGHELAHVARRHVQWSAAVTTLAFAGVSLVAVFTSVRWEAGGARLPLLLLVGAITMFPLRLVLAWTSRAHERQADRLALAMSPIDPLLVARLHLSDRPLLEPSRLAGALHSHPPPAERVECAARRSGRSVGGERVTKSA